MTRSDRDQLLRVLRQRVKVAKTEVDQRAAELRADFERQLAARYTFGDEAWQAITAEAKLAVDEADARIADICRERGIPAEFRPGLNLGWYGRGENAAKERRGELRKSSTETLLPPVTLTSIEEGRS